MAYNFKSIADVEVVAEPSESANVLIEENGVIKKAPKDAVGGGGAGGGCDAMITFENLNYSEYGTFTIGDYQTLYDKINALQEVKVLVGAKQVVGYDAKTIYVPVEYGLYEDTINIIIQNPNEAGHRFYIHINGDDNVQAQSQPPG
jgi:hypothetical protein